MLLNLPPEIQFRFSGKEQITTPGANEAIIKFCKQFKKIY
jgi:hypothetical protein